MRLDFDRICHDDAIIEVINKRQKRFPTLHPPHPPPLFAAPPQPNIPHPLSSDIVVTSNMMAAIRR